MVIKHLIKAYCKPVLLYACEFWMFNTSCIARYRSYVGREGVFIGKCLRSEQMSCWFYWSYWVVWFRVRWSADRPNWLLFTNCHVHQIKSLKVWQGWNLLRNVMFIFLLFFFQGRSDGWISGFIPPKTNFWLRPWYFLAMCLFFFVFYHCFIVLSVCCHFGE